DPSIYKNRRRFRKVLLLLYNLFCNATLVPIYTCQSIEAFWSQLRRHFTEW
uniref:Uncharacterized protein n=1 Tax=Amphimedon queenslandica TaxID=400682 RepID=A0A1X7V2M4_AMPQE